METKKCPYCGEEIKIEAIKCKYCGEFLNKQNDNTIESDVRSKPLNIPSAWNAFRKRKWIEWITWIGIGLIFVIIKELTKIQINNMSETDIEKVLYLSSSIISIITIFYFYLLVQYARNFNKEFSILKIYFWLYTALAFFGLWSSVNDLSTTPTELGSFGIIVSLLLVFTVSICQIIASRSLMKIKGDIIGGLKTIGTSFLIFAIVDLFLYVLTLVLALFEGMNEGLNDGIQATTNSSSPTTTCDIISSLISIAFSFVIIYLISQTLKKAEMHNQISSNENEK